MKILSRAISGLPVILIKDKRYFGRFIIGFFLIIFYIGASITNQINYIFTPFLKSCKYIPYMLPKDDLAQLKELAYPVYRIINEIEKYPEYARFYFAPCFEDSNNTGIWWWYLFILTRYLYYPKEIFSIDKEFYNNNKAEYMEKFIKGAKRYNELEWIKKMGIEYVILFRNNKFSILPADSNIAL